MEEENNDTLSPRLLALRDTVIEIEQYVAKSGWDGPIRLFALVDTKKALAQTPELAATLAHEADTENPAFFSIEQEKLPEADSLEELLGQVYWPESVDGAAVSVERIVLPPAAEKDLPQDENAAIHASQTHPDRQEVRMVAAYTRDGEIWSALRMRNYDQDSLVLSGKELLKDLSAELAVTFEELPEEML